MSTELFVAAGSVSPGRVSVRLGLGLVDTEWFRDLQREVPMAVKSSLSLGGLVFRSRLDAAWVSGETPLIECRTPPRVRGSATYRRKSDNLAGAVVPGWMTTDRWVSISRWWLPMPLATGWDGAREAGA